MSFSWSLMGLVLFNICVSNMNSGIKFNLSNFDKDTKLRGAVNILDGRDTIRMDLERLERRAHVTHFKFNTAKHKVLYLCWGNAKRKYRMGREWTESSLPSEERDLGELNRELNRSQPCALAGRKPNVSWTTSKHYGQQDEGGDSPSTALW